ncbi:MAG TPA: DUF6064 family protein [Lamprocystis sp. (in: g-proteobacteria)]|nr:DUF6064 family protein [Lamprocystis sp. (in: g-proteobacteria)]
MGIPFTVEQFYGVFRAYNIAVWPAQWFLVLLGLAAVVLALAPRRGSGVAVSAILGALWAWIAVAYHLAFFARISPPAYGFAALAAAGAVVFIWVGVIRRSLAFKWVSDLKSAAGITLIIFALALYPAWSIDAGHPYPELPTFGLPCPTTIFTIGVLCFAVPPTPRRPLIVPLLGCLVGTQAAFLFGVWPDLGLIAAAAVGIGLLLTAGQRRRTMTP